MREFPKPSKSHFGNTKIGLYDLLIKQTLQLDLIWDIKLDTIDLTTLFLPLFDILTSLDLVSTPFDLIFPLLTS